LDWVEADPVPSVREMGPARAVVAVWLGQGLEAIRELGAASGVVDVVDWEEGSVEDVPREDGLVLRVAVIAAPCGVEEEEDPSGLTSPRMFRD
jgi:hypothetical protein